MPPIFSRRNLNKLRPYLLDRLSEASTYRGIILVITALGIKINPSEAEAITVAGLAMSGIIGVLLKDNDKP